MRDRNARATRSAVADIGDFLTHADAFVSVGKFGGISSEGRFLVELPARDAPLLALSTIALDQHDEGAEVVVAFAAGERGSPIIIGRLQQAASNTPHTFVDGERIVIRADREIELRCGNASIVLTRAGKVLIRGNYVLTRSRGANKIKGAFVDIN